MGGRVGPAGRAGCGCCCSQGGPVCRRLPCGCVAQWPHRACWQNCGPLSRCPARLPLQYVAVQRLRGWDARAPILCFIGPPGVVSSPSSLLRTGHLLPHSVGWSRALGLAGTACSGACLPFVSCAHLSVLALAVQTATRPPLHPSLNAAAPPPPAPPWRRARPRSRGR